MQADFTPKVMMFHMEHLKTECRVAIRRHGRIGSAKLAYRALSSAIRAQGAEITAAVQKANLVAKFGERTAHALFMAAAQAAR